MCESCKSDEKAVHVYLKNNFFRAVLIWELRPYIDRPTLTLNIDLINLGHTYLLFLKYNIV